MAIDDALTEVVTGASSTRDDDVVVQDNDECDDGMYESDDDIKIDADYVGDNSESKSEFLSILNSDSRRVMLAFQILVDQHFPGTIIAPPPDYNAVEDIVFIEEGGVDDGEKSDSLTVLAANISLKMKEGKSIWLVLDTAATEHVFTDLELISDQQHTLCKVTGVSGSSTNLDCVGNAELLLADFHDNSER